MKMIRRSGLAIFVAVVALIGGFNLLRLDSIIKSILQDQASLAVGARVDIGDLKFSPFGLDIEIRNLRVADPDEPMRNIFEARNVTLDLAALPLLRRKFVVQRLKAEDIVWATPRQTSGGLPPRLRQQPKRPYGAQIGRQGDREIQDCVLPDLSLLQNPEDGLLGDFLAETSLPSSDFLAARQQEFTNLKTSWDRHLAGLPTEKEIKDSLAALRNLTREMPKATGELSGCLRRVTDAEQRLADIRKNLLAARAEFQKQVRSLKCPPSELKRLEKQDFKTLWTRLDIREPRAEDLLCVLLGKDIARKVDHVLAWYRRIARFMPSGPPEGRQQEPRTRPASGLKGLDVLFPVTSGWPKFVLEVGEFSALPHGGAEPGRALFSRLSGEVQGLTSQPALYGKPTVFRFEATLPGEEPGRLVFFAEFDHRKRPSRDHMELLIKSLRLDRSQDGLDRDRALLLTSASLDMEGDIRFRGEDMEGTVRVSLNRPKVKLGSGAALLAGLFDNPEPLEMDLYISGTIDQPRMRLATPASTTLSASLERVFRARRQSLRRKVRKIVNSRLHEKLTAFQVQVATYEKRVLGDLVRRLHATRPVKQKGGRGKTSLQGAATGQNPSERPERLA